jgi:hypothetical protein
MTEMLNFVALHAYVKDRNDRQEERERAARQRAYDRRAARAARVAQAPDWPRRISLRLRGWSVRRSDAWHAAR